MAVTESRAQLMLKFRNLSEDELDTTFWSRAEVAVILAVTESAIEKRDALMQPPEPVGGYRVKAKVSQGTRYTEGKQVSGDEQGNRRRRGPKVEYRARTLKNMMFGNSTGSEANSTANLSPQLALASAMHGMSSLSGFLSDDALAHRQAWVSTAQAESEEAEFAFFVDERGLVLTHAWQSVDQTFEMLMSPKTDVVWQTWIAALADVWADEGERQRVMQECADIDASVPEKVQALRDAKLASI